MNRAQGFDRLNQPFDLIIIGGGASGLGAAVDASSRGYKVALFEAQDFAQGTSSRATKLVHGGVRYLAQGNIGLVRDALRERGRLRKNAPHLVGDLEFIVPAYAWWNGPYYGMGLKLYDVLAGRYKLGKTRSLSRAQVLERIPTLEPEDLRGGILYFDGQFDDARLAMALALTAHEQGATLLNHCPVEQLLKAGGRICGVIARDAESGKAYSVKARAVLNATGVFADRIRALDEPDVAPLVAPSQGVHLVLPADFLPSKYALMVPKTDDGRVLFVVPWHGRALVGTTDTAVPQVTEDPQPLEEEVRFLLDHAARYLARDPKREDVLSVFVGLRPLARAKEGKSTRALSRDHLLFRSSSGLITLVGGKWTTYRKMAEDAVNMIAEEAGLEERPCATAQLPLHGAPPDGRAQISQTGAPSEVLSAYGTDAEKVRALAEQDESLAVPLHPKLPYLAAEVVWAAREEMALCVEDVLSRRTRALILDARASWECAPKVASLLARELHRDAAWEADQLARYQRRVEASLLRGESPSEAQISKLRA